MEELRLSRYLARAGVGSRRFCDSLIASGDVTVNGEVVLENFSRVSTADEVVVDGEKIVVSDCLCYYLLNKPRGYVCSLTAHGYEELAVDLIKTDVSRVFSVGRLDRDSEGLIIFTNDGEFTHQVEHPNYGKVKRYLVTVSSCPKPTQDAFDKIEKGIVDGGELLKPLSVKYDGEERYGAHILEFRLSEGKNREVRRICRAMNWRVKRLQRVAIGPVELGDLKLGASRLLSEDEVKSILD